MESAEGSSVFSKELCSKKKTCAEDVKFYLRKRNLVTFLVFLGWILLFVLRTNLSLCLVDMTSKKSVTIGNMSFERKAEFNWSTTEQSLILSSFSWGYFASPVGALLANKFGGVTVFISGVAMTGFLTMLTPVIMAWSLPTYLVARVLEGALEGIAVTASADIFVQWCPPTERSRSTITMSIGMILGSTISYPVCGTIAFYMNWRAVFYITGGAALVWYLVCLTLIKNSPLEDNLITETERKYLSRVNPYISKIDTIGIHYPWKRILTSKPVWAFANDLFVAAWSWSFLTYCLPLYIKDSFDVDIRDIGFIAGIPNFCGIIGLAGGAILADYLRNHKILKITNVHRIFLFFAQSTGVITLLIAAASNQNFVISIICLSCFRLFYTISDISYQVLPIDLGARYASLLFGLGVMSLSLGYALNPIVMGLMVPNHTAIEWSRYFLALSTFNAWGGVIFYFFGSGDLQPWADLPLVSKTEEQSVQ